MINPSQTSLQTHLDASLLIFVSVYFMFSSSSLDIKMHNVHAHDMIIT
jgi:hypothetical protein